MLRSSPSRYLKGANRRPTPTAHSAASDGWRVLLAPKRGKGVIFAALEA